MSPTSNDRTARRRPRLAVWVTHARADERAVDDRVDLPWLPAALIGGLVAAGLGWVLCAGLAVIGWLGAEASTLGRALLAGSQLWFLGHGAGAHVADLHWTLTPLGLSLVFGLVLSWVAGFAARHARRAAPDEPPGPVARRVTLAVAGGYVGLVLLVCVLVGEPAQLGRVLLGSATIALVGAWLGATRVLGHRLSDDWPAWARPVPRAVGGGLATMLVLGGTLVTIALIRTADKITALAGTLELGALGGAVVLLLQLAYLPDLIVWAGSYLLGPGFSLGDGSLVSPVVTKVGLLPAIPAAAAAPASHIGTGSALLWLLGGALPGVVAAALVMRARPLARFDETSLVGGLAGVLTGLVFALVGVAAHGDLGTGRLVGIGPRLTELAVMSATVMGLAGMATGLIWGLIRFRSWRAAGTEEFDEEHEPTRRVPRP